MRQYKGIGMTGAARLRPVLAFFVLGMGVLSLSRLMLSVWKSTEVSAVDGWGAVLLQGLRVDVASLCLLLVPLAAALLVLPQRWFFHRSVSLARVAGGRTDVAGRTGTGHA